MAHKVDNYYLAPPAPNCLCTERFPFATRPEVPLPGPPRGTMEEDYGLHPALQCWVEKANLPMPGQPCLLGGVCPGIVQDDGTVCFFF